MFRRLLFSIGLFIITLPLSAQFDISDFRWDLANLAFSYPASWDEPFAVQHFGIESVIMAESESTDTERAPEIPFITLSLHPKDETDLKTLAQQLMSEIEIRPAFTIPAAVLDQDALWTQGYSRDETYFGIGVITELENNILAIVGRVPAEQATQFEYNVDLLIRSLVQDADFGDIVPFGIVWDNSANRQDNETAYTNLRALAVDEPHNALYAVDEVLGLLKFDMLSGRLKSIIPNSDFITPTAITVGTNSIYVADADCNCIHVYQNNEWQDPLDGFDSDEPFSIVTTPDENLYATDYDGENFYVRQYSTDGIITDLYPDEPLDDQPQLFVADNMLHMLSPETGEIFQLGGTDFIPVTALTLDTIPQYALVVPDGTSLVVSDSLINFYTVDDIWLDTIDITDYSEGSVITGLAIDSHNTLYVATLGDDIGEVLALSQRVPKVGTGLQTLAPYRTSSGFLNEDNEQDIWFIDGTARDTMSLFVQGYSELGDFNYSMTFLAPDGTEIISFAEDSDQQTRLSRGFQDYELPDTGIYQVQINRLASQGGYDITFATVEEFTLNPDVTTIWGEVSQSYPQEMWSFEGTAGTTITLTMRASIPTQLDPYMILYDSQYNLLEQNDDADDSTLGSTAQIKEIRLSRNGTYYLDALRLDGEGRYSLTIEVVEPE